MGSLQADIVKLGGQPLAIAVTATYSQLAFAESLGLTFPMLSDWDSTAAAAYGVRYDSWKGHTGLAKRSVFVIDSGGIVRYRWATDDAESLPPLGDAVMALGRLQGGRAK